MKNIINNFGKNAGRIWKTLDKYGPLNEVELINKTKINRNDFYVGIGWLARENKICKVGNKYQLGETNLSNEIGSNAGKVWNTLNTTQNINVTTIAENSKIKIRDAYTALGWLSRENKIQTSSDKKNKFKLK